MHNGPHVIAVYPDGSEVSFTKCIVGSSFRNNGIRPIKFRIPENLHPSEVHYLYGYVAYRKGDHERLEVVKDVM